MRRSVPRVWIFYISPGIKLNKTRHSGGEFIPTSQKRVFQQNRPKADAHDAIFSVFFGENRRSESYLQWLLITLKSQRICLSLIWVIGAFHFSIKGTILLIKGFHRSVCINLHHNTQRKSRIVCYRYCGCEAVRFAASVCVGPA